MSSPLRPRTSAPPSLVINPLEDEAFVAAVRAAAPGTVTPQSLEAALRPDFGAVVVRPRVVSGEMERVWYVYRDGSWTPPHHEVEGDDGRDGPDGGRGDAASRG